MYNTLGGLDKYLSLACPGAVGVLGWDGQAMGTVQSLGLTASPEVATNPAFHGVWAGPFGWLFFFTQPDLRGVNSGRQWERGIGGNLGENLL